MSGGHFIVQTSKVLLIDVTAVTLGQGHGKVIQYISPDLYILCPKYLRFSSNGFDVRDKSRCGGRGRRGGNEPFQSFRFLTNRHFLTGLPGDQQRTHQKFKNAYCNSGFCLVMTIGD